DSIDRDTRPRSRCPGGESRRRPPVPGRGTGHGATPRRELRRDRTVRRAASHECRSADFFGDGNHPVRRGPGNRPPHRRHRL
ncbi:MAG: hypothetical protein AVDCRST_MAG70-719, partial [uncultured Thermomicrobiales bacterium]